MAFYAVIIEGANIPARVLEDADGFIGFFTTRFVEAVNEEAAEAVAIELIRQELKQILRAQLAGEGNLVLSLDRISEVEALPENAPGAGFTWFAMGT